MRYRTAIVVCALAGALVAPTTAQAETLTLSARADAYTLKSSTTKNFGTATTLRVRDPGVRSYVKFEVSGVPTGSTVTAASLRLHSSTGDSAPPRSRRCGPTSTRRAQTSSSTVMNTTISAMSP